LKNHFTISNCFYSAKRRMLRQNGGCVKFVFKVLRVLNFSYPIIDQVLSVHFEMIKMHKG
jgi:hypothetical protein